jgi:outer membrane protein assembly factor BamB
VPGQPILSGGQPSPIAGDWPCFRGADHDAISKEKTPLARHWPAGGPKRLWTVKLGEGFAAAAVSAGRVYVLDHVRDAPPNGPDRSADTMRCLSLGDGREIWRNSYPVVVPPHHGMSRTIPAVVGKYVVSLGPLCQVACWDAQSGKANWLMDLVLDYGATVPPWYAGQCPLVDAVTDRLILAPGGRALLVAVDYRSGKVIWESPNPHGWTMTHVSIVPMDFAGRRMYVYCGNGGVAGVDATDGKILWDTSDWQISVATCPSPVVIGDGRIFFSGGYNAGALMLKVEDRGGSLVANTLWRLTARQFGSEQQTPILFDGHLYGIRQHDQKLVCLDLQGKELWNSGRDKFGSAPYLIADGLIYAMNDDGMLLMAEATPGGYRPLGRAQVIDDGVTCWGPMALVAGRLIVRDLTRMTCLDVAEKQ